MKKPIFTGVCTALVTPFLGETINTPMLRQLIRRQEQAGIDGLVICGTTGESATLSDGEKTELFRVSWEAIPENMAFLAGTGSNDTAHAVALSQTAEGCGADGLLVVSPYYNKATEDGLYRHYEAIAQAVHIPVVLYNLPGRTGLDIPVSVYKALSALPNVIGVKEASPDIRKIAPGTSSSGAAMTIWPCPPWRWGLWGSSPWFPMWSRSEPGPWSGQHWTGTSTPPLTSSWGSCR